jgi:hypothetical protein
MIRCCNLSLNVWFVVALACLYLWRLWDVRARFVFSSSSQSAYTSYYRNTENITVLYVLITLPSERPTVATTRDTSTFDSALTESQRRLVPIERVGIRLNLARSTCT